MVEHDQILDRLINQLTNYGVEVTPMGIEVIGQHMWVANSPARSFIRHAPDIFCRYKKYDCFIDIKLSASKTDNLAIDLMSWVYSNNLKRMTSLTDSYIMLGPDKFTEIGNLKPQVVFLPTSGSLINYYNKLFSEFCSGARIKDLSPNNGSGDPFILFPIKSFGKYIVPTRTLHDIWGLPA